MGHGILVAEVPPRAPFFSPTENDDLQNSTRLGNWPVLLRDDEGRDERHQRADPKANRWRMSFRWEPRHTSGIAACLRCVARYRGSAKVRGRSRGFPS